MEVDRITVPTAPHMASSTYRRLLKDGTPRQLFRSDSARYSCFLYHYGNEQILITRLSAHHHETAHLDSQN